MDFFIFRRATLDLLCCNFRGGDVIQDDFLEAATMYAAEAAKRKAEIEDQTNAFTNDDRHFQQAQAAVLVPDGMPTISSVNRTYM